MKKLLFALLLLATPAVAVKVDEILDDPALEARARQISEELRCPKCTSESIDESNADIARSLRLLVRERLLAGDTDEEVIAFVVARYTEAVLMKPNRQGANLLLWWAGPALLILGLGAGWLAIRPRKTQTAHLTKDEESRLAELLKDD